MPSSRGRGPCQGTHASGCTARAQHLVAAKQQNSPRPQPPLKQMSPPQPGPPSPPRRWWSTPTNTTADPKTKRSPAAAETRQRAPPRQSSSAAAASRAASSCTLSISSWAFLKASCRTRRREDANCQLSATRKRPCPWPFLFASGARRRAAPRVFDSPALLAASSPPLSSCRPCSAGSAARSLLAPRAANLRAPAARARAGSRGAVRTPTPEMRGLKQSGTGSVCPAPARPPRAARVAS